MNEIAAKLTFKEKVGYSLGDTASNLFFQTFILFLLYFYTDVFGISAASVATIFLIGRIWDAVNDPLMGMIADRTSTKLGKFRPYLLYAAVPFGVFGFLMFVSPNLSTQGKVIYAFITYNFMMMIYTVINVPYSALMGVLTPNSQERTVVSSFRFVAAFAGQFIVQFAVLWLVGVFGKGNETLGWRWAMAVIAALAVVLWLATFATTRERVKPIKEQKNPLRQDLSDLFKNIPWVLIGSATLFQLLYIVIRGGSIMYYFKYFVQDQQLSLMGRSFSFSYQSLTSAFLLFGTAVTILGAVLTNVFSRHFGKSRCYFGFLGIAAVSTALFYFLKPQDIVLMFVLQILISFSVGPVSVLQWAIYTDAADYSEWKNGRRATALLMAASLFALKLGIALAGTIQAWILDAIGFVANTAQSVASLSGIKMLMSVIPAAAGLIAVALMIFYPLNNEKMVQIEKDLSAKRQQ